MGTCILVYFVSVKLSHQQQVRVHKVTCHSAGRGVLSLLSSTGMLAVDITGVHLLLRCDVVCGGSSMESDGWTRLRVRDWGDAV
jgi:hypothetical protein